MNVTGANASKTLRPVIQRTIILVSWAVSVVALVVAAPILHADYGWSGVGLMALITAPMHIMFWSTQRMRVELERDHLIIVRPLSTVHVPRSQVRSASIAQGALWGALISLSTDDGEIPVPVFQASHLRRDSWTHQDLRWALNEINSWAAAPLDLV